VEKAKRVAMRENLADYADGWTFVSEQKKERLIEEIAGLLEAYDDLKGSSQVPDELAGLLKLAQSGSCEVVAAIKSLSPVAHSMLNYPEPLPDFTARSHTSINDEIIQRLLKSVRSGHHLDRAQMRVRRVQNMRFVRPPGRPANGPEMYLTASLAVIYQKYAGKKPTIQYSINLEDGYEPTEAQCFMNDIMKLAGIRGENPSFKLLKRHLEAKRRINKCL
jgi:hypothetical protein